jgi:hypothetical protein
VTTVCEEQSIPAESNQRIEGAAVGEFRGRLITDWIKDHVSVLCAARGGEEFARSGTSAALRAEVHYLGATGLGRLPMSLDYAPPDRLWPCNRGMVAASIAVERANRWCCSTASQARG